MKRYQVRACNIYKNYCKNIVYLIYGMYYELYVYSSIFFKQFKIRNDI